MRLKPVRFVLVMAVLGLGAVGSLSASPSLVLDPVFGNLADAPGSVVGWGFTITNDTGYIEINSAQFCLNPVSLPGCIDPLTGTFTDIIAGSNDIIVGPPGGTYSSIVTQAFDLVLQTGIGSFQIFPTTLPGDSDSGLIVLSYTLTDLDPNDPNAVRIGTGYLTADATVTAAVPEPATVGLVALVLAGILRKRATFS